MTQQFQSADRHGIVRRFDYDDRVVLVADFGYASDGSVDVLDGTAIVILGDDQFELSLPEGTLATASMNNGVVTIEIEQ
jgi:hypothetical protein